MQYSRNVKYVLYGYYVSRDWFGDQFVQLVYLDDVSETLLEMYRKDPLQDYNGVGVRSVDYVHIKVFKKETWIEDDWEYTRISTNPVETLQAGTPNEKLVDEFFEKSAFC